MKSDFNLRIGRGWGGCTVALILFVTRCALELCLMKQRVQTVLWKKCTSLNYITAKSLGMKNKNTFCHFFSSLTPHTHTQLTFSLKLTPKWTSCWFLAGPRVVSETYDLFFHVLLASSFNYNWTLSVWFACLSSGKQHSLVMIRSRLSLFIFWVKKRDHFVRFNKRTLTQRVSIFFNNYSLVFHWILLQENQMKADKRLKCKCWCGLTATTITPSGLF